MIINLRYHQEFILKGGGPCVNRPDAILARPTRCVEAELECPVTSVKMQMLCRLWSNPLCTVHMPLLLTLQEYILRGVLRGSACRC